MKELTLGEKLKHFRKLKKISQSKLEIATDLAFGSISRIESGQTNPTKESVIKIARQLDLNNSDIDYLLGFRNSAPTEKEIEKVVKKVRPIVDQELFPGYLMDNRFRVWAYNKSVLEVLGIPQDEAAKKIGSNVVQILLLMFNILKRIPRKYLLTVIEDQLAFYKQETKRYENESYERNLRNDLEKSRVFKKVWSHKINDEEAYRWTKFYINYENKVLDFMITRTIFPFDERFTLVEYYPSDKTTVEVFGKIKSKFLKK